ncbi:MAG: HD domain-containing protein [Candidatus Pacebacteria bacterium]|nr:HD domain-containing protein [Candidatus Paceibacterota bacterium]MBP9842993.1 HD domain-containing protein [Candidatus Paceibacterota bacterium]
MIYTPLLHRAFHFAITIHEVEQKQKRKGKDVAYVTHPIQVGLILAKAGAPEHVIAAGFLHDTTEDSIEEAKVTKEELEAEFGSQVADLVASVSEKNRALSWQDRKETAMEEIRHFSHDSLLLKSGDVISNTTELLSDFERDGNATFKRFNAPKAQLIEHAQEVIATIISAWPENPLADDLQNCHDGLEDMKPDMKVTYVESEIDPETKQRMIATALAPIFEAAERTYREQQNTSE